ncbi:MAG: S8 family serine peptidase [Solirubrobacterales bacterium]
MRRLSTRRIRGMRLISLAIFGGLLAAVALASTAAAVVMRPSVHEYQQVSRSETPPTEAQCFSAGRRCFTPQAIQASYNVLPLYAAGIDGSGFTVAVVDSYGNDNMAHDLHVFDQAFGLPPMCGEQGVDCQPGMPKFKTFHLQGSPETKPPPDNNSPGQEDKSAWALEVALDVETAHAMAPGANILLVTTPNAETLGVQGFPNMMKAEKYVIEHGMADVISQSFGSAEEAFGSAQSLRNLRDAFVAAQQHDVTVLASSGDTGTANDKKTPVGKGGGLINEPTVSWPASDPLVTGVGGTSLCTDPFNTTTRTVDNADPPTACQDAQAVGQAEIVWQRLAGGVATGGGFSHVFDRPAYQDTLPAGSTAIGANRGVPDVALQANSRTGALVYLSLPPDGNSGLICGDTPCSTGWYDIGGTSLSSPQWGGLVALADQIRGGRLGLINPALYAIASDPAAYANDYFDVTVGNNQADPSIPGYNASPGWDPATGLGTPNAANLLPALAAAGP